MPGGLLEDKELRAADARRKLEWLKEEAQEVESLPPFREYHLLNAKQRMSELTPVEKARISEFVCSQEKVQHLLYVGALSRAINEVKAAESDLELYRKSNVLSWPAHGAISRNGESTAFY